MLAAVRQDVTIRDARLRVQWLRHLREQDVSRPVLVFLHEALGCIRMWRGFPRALARATGLDAMLYDRQGHGASSRAVRARGQDYLHAEAADVLPELLRTFKLIRPLLIGHSDGGSIALIYASRFPDNVAGVVAEAAHVLVEAETLAGIHLAVDRYDSGKLRLRLAQHHGDNAEPLFRAWADTWLDPRFAHWNIAGELAQIVAPVFVIQGDRDQYATQRQVTQIVAGLSGPSRMLIVDDCGHTPHLEQPERLVREIAAFIAELGLSA